MKGFWENLLYSKGNISSKRLMGVVCIVFAMVFAILGLLLGEIGTVDGMVSTVVIEFLTAGVALFGVTAWEKRGIANDEAKIKQNNSNSSEYTSEYDKLENDESINDETISK